MGLTIYIHSIMPSGGGGVGPFWMAGYLLERDAPNFGSGIERMEIYVYFREGKEEGSLIAKQLFTDLVHAFESKLNDLPRFQFQRTKKVFRFEFLSSISGDLLRKHYLPPGPQNTDWAAQINADLLQEVYPELLDAFLSLRTKVKSKDDFDVEGFLSWSIQKQSQLPRSGKEFLKLKEEQYSRATKVEYEKRNAQLKVEWPEISWKDYSPVARSILDDPFYWDDTDENSPHGNDTGADLLHEFMKWRKKSKEKSSSSFFKTLLNNWGLNEEKEDAFGMIDQAIIALAFAHLKLDGACPTAVKEKALNSIRSQKSKLGEWLDQAERTDALSRMEVKLVSAPCEFD